MSADAAFHCPGLPSYPRPCRTRKVCSCRVSSVADVRKAARARGLELENKSLGPLLKMRVFGKDGNFAGEISGAVLGSRLHVEAYRARAREGPGGLLAVSPGMFLFIAGLAFAKERGCESVYGLAIDDGDVQHRRLVRYLERFGGVAVRKVADGLGDVPVRMFYGGVGTVIKGDVENMLARGGGMLERTTPVLPVL